MTIFSRGLALAALLCLVTAPARSATLKVATVLPEGSAWMQQMRSAAKTLDKRTAGRVKLKFYPGGVMGNARTVLRKIRAGQLHGGAFNSGALTSVFRETELYSLPLLFRDYAEVDYVRAQMDPVIREGLGRAGLDALAIGDGGFAYLVSHHPVRSVDDLDHTKVWILENDPMSRAALETVDVAPIPLPLSDVYTGLQTGLIDTVVAPPSAVIAFQWHTKLRFVTDAPLLYLIGIMAFDKKALTKLGDDDRDTLREVIEEASRELDLASRVSDADAMKALGGQGIETVQVGAQELERWRLIASQTIERLRKEGAYSPVFLDAMLGHLDTYRRGRADP